EVLPEFHVAAKQTLVLRAIGRRLVREAHPQRLPVGSQQQAQDAKADADRKLRRLTHRADVADDQLLAQHGDVARLLERQEQHLVQLAPVLGQSLEREAQRWLLAYQQADRTEVGKPPR